MTMTRVGCITILHKTTAEFNAKSEQDTFFLFDLRPNGQPFIEPSSKHVATNC
jgi:hypothetical protein